MPVDVLDDILFLALALVQNKGFFSIWISLSCTRLYSINLDSSSIILILT